MGGILKNLLAMGINVGLSDRDAFVKKASEIIQQYQNDPETAEKWANTFVGYMQDMKENIRQQSNIEASIADAGLPKKENIEDLTKAITKLTEELQKIKK